MNLNSGSAGKWYLILSWVFELSDSALPRVRIRPTVKCDPKMWGVRPSPGGRLAQPIRSEPAQWEGEGPQQTSVLWKCSPTHLPYSSCSCTGLASQNVCRSSKRSLRTKRVPGLLLEEPWIRYALLFMDMEHIYSKKELGELTATQRERLNKKQPANCIFKGCYFWNHTI